MFNWHCLVHLHLKLVLGGRQEKQIQEAPRLTPLTARAQVSGLFGALVHVTNGALEFQTSIIWQLWPLCLEILRKCGRGHCPMEF